MTIIDAAAERIATETPEKREARNAKILVARAKIRDAIRARAATLRMWSHAFLAVLALVLMAGGYFFYYAGDLAKRDLQIQLQERLKPVRQALEAQKKQLSESQGEQANLKQKIVALVPSFASLKPAKTPFNISPYTSLSQTWFVDSRQGWTVGVNGTILSTADGGATWQKRDSGTTVPLLSVQFVNATQGWTVGVNGTILSTADGGATWQKRDSGTPGDLNSVQFVNATQGWTVGDNGTILSTADGGATWQKRDSGTTRTLYSVQFVNATQGWTVGVNGTILSTADGGATWQKRDSGTTGYLYSVQFVNATQGWTVGDNGTILQVQVLVAPNIDAANTAVALRSAVKFAHIENDPVIHPLLDLYEAKYNEIDHLRSSITALASEFPSRTDEDATNIAEKSIVAKSAIAELFYVPNFVSFMLRLGISGFVFFFVGFVITAYRYLMRLVAHYDACADALELCDDPLDPAFRSLVRTLSPAAIDFGKEPRSFIDRVFDTAENLASRVKDAKE